MVSEMIVPGLKGQKETVVCEHNVARHVNTFSSPSMIALMEQASTDALHSHLEPNQTSVGFEVNVRHLAPSPLGARITAHAKLVEVDRNKLTFKVEAYNEEKTIGEGTHRRAIVSKDFGSG